MVLDSQSFDVTVVFVLKMITRDALNSPTIDPRSDRWLTDVNFSKNCNILLIELTVEIQAVRSTDAAKCKNKNFCDEPGSYVVVGMIELMRLKSFIENSKQSSYLHLAF